ncbi:MAG: hypothetical protein H6624_13530 [Bdellovibrionaceae bacterium]|nr:hypothetical protein [Bdellovibrionales bacterium]MCB9085364.1 hypothetical protein [Pseudobdellovibrionaceae bacterium]
MKKTIHIAFFTLIIALIPGACLTALAESDPKSYVEEPLGSIEEQLAGRDKNECGECSKHFRDDQLGRGDNPRQVTDRVARALSGEATGGDTGTKSTK